MRPTKLRKKKPIKLTRIQLKVVDKKQPVNYGTFNLTKYWSLISQKSSKQKAHSLDKKQ